MSSKGAAGLAEKAILPALGSLVEAGYIQRGRSLRCPRCSMPGYWRLAELDEKLRCAACQELFSLPAVDGDREALAAIRLLPRPASRYRLHATRHWVRTLTLEPGAPHLSLRR